MKILYVASECTPFIKSGGLADVAGSLPQGIKKQGHDIRVVLPFYSSIPDKHKEDLKEVVKFKIDLGWRSQYVGVLEKEYNGITYYFIDNEYYYKRDGLYGYYDDGERYIFFSKAIAMMIKHLDFMPQIVHSNDWHTGLIPLYIKDFAKGDKLYEDIRTVFTIHNLKYQGVFDYKVLSQIGGLSQEYFNEEGLKFYDAVNLMKAGIVYSDKLTTVSQTYAEEIKTQYFGENLDGIIRKHQDKLIGIINGIDYDFYNPQTDKNIERNYSFKTIKNKKINKKALQDLYGLPKKDVPMISMVSRLVEMKGMDLVSHIMEELIQEDIQVLVLGTGDNKYEEMLRYFQYKYPDKMAVRLYFNEKEAHNIYAGSDIFLMPSMKEPCGISQLIAMRYGTIPIVRKTGGLKDTVRSYDKYKGTGTGFSFLNFNAHELLFTIKDAIELYKVKDKWTNMIKEAMESKNNWQESSKEYIELYEELH